MCRNYICVALWREGKIALKVAIGNSIIPCIVIVKVLSTMIRGKINQKIKYNWKDWLRMVTTRYRHNAIFSQKYNGFFWPTFIFWHIHIVLMDCLCYKEQIVVIYIYIIIDQTNMFSICNVTSHVIQIGTETVQIQYIDIMIIWYPQKCDKFQYIIIRVQQKTLFQQPLNWRSSWNISLSISVL